MKIRKNKNRIGKKKMKIIKIMNKKILKMIFKKILKKIK